VDLRSFALEGKIDPQTLIKVAQRVNYDLGLRISQPQERVVELDHGKVRLPDNFHVMNFAFICGKFELDIAIPQGTHIEDWPPTDQGMSYTKPLRPLNDYTSNDPFLPFYKDPKDPHLCGVTPVPLFCEPTELRNTVTPACLTKCGDEYRLIQIVNRRRETCHIFEPLKFIDSTNPNRHVHTHFNGVPNDVFPLGGEFRNLGPRNHAWLKDNFLWTNLDCAHIYLNYMGDMTNDEGELLVPDHAEINEYYETALKVRILENLLMDGTEVTKQLQYMTQQMRIARNYSLTIVNTPNFSEMQALWSLNRRAMYNKYYQMFESFPNVDNNLQQGNQV